MALVPVIREMTGNMGLESASTERMPRPVWGAGFLFSLPLASMSKISCEEENTLNQEIGGTAFPFH